MDLSEDHCHSIPCSKSELDIRYNPLKQQGIIQGKFYKYLPISPLTDGDVSVIEFYIPGSSDKYIDPQNIRLGLKLKLMKSNGTALVADDDVALCNNLLGCLFEAVKLYLNEKMISSATRNYDYRSDFEKKVNYDQSSLKTRLSSEGWEPDTPGHFGPVATNLGYVARKRWTTLSRVYQIMGRPHLDFCHQEKLLVNGISMRLQFCMNDLSKCIMQPVANTETYKLHIQEAALYVRKATVNPSILADHALTLEKGIPCGYTITKVEVKHFSVAAGTQSQNLEDICGGKVPQSCVFAQVSNRAANGDVNENAYEYKHYDLSSIKTTLNGIDLPGERQSLNFTGDNESHLDAYLSLFEVNGKSQREGSISFTRNGYKNGNMMIGFNFRPDLSNDHCIKGPNQKGNFRIELQWRTPLPETINIVLYLTYDCAILFDRDRNIFMDYNP